MSVKSLLSFFEGGKFLKVSFIFFVLAYCLMIVNGFYNCSFSVADNDNYKELFERFLQQGYYKSAAEGTSILYNSFLQGIYYLTNGVDSSFFILNAISEFAVMVIGYYFCKNVVKQIDIYFYIVVTAFILYMINLKSYLSASNDCFLGVFVVTLLYLLVIEIYNRKKEVLIFGLIGLVWALCFAVRYTAILLLPLVVIALIYWVKNTQIETSRRFGLFSLSVVVFVGVTLMFHYPSIIDQHKLSHEDKDPGGGLTWVQRNYLGFKKIESGEEKRHRDAIWVNTKFDVVQRYVDANGVNSLPKSFPEVVKMDPKLLAKVALYNSVTAIGRYMRFWGFIFIVPLLSLNRKVFAKEKLPTLLFIVFLIIISTVCFAFVEFRWFYGYEVLVPVSILLSLGASRIFNANPKKNLLFAVSLLFVALFNLKTLYAHI